MEMDFKQLASAIRLIADEKNLPEEQVQEIVITVTGSKRCA
jgi:hypothetical protein